LASAHLGLVRVPISMNVTPLSAGFPLVQIPVQLLNFRYIPVRHQLNVVLVTSVVWTALLSAWYPPTKPDPESDKEKESAAPGAAAAEAVAVASTK
jgi:ethanolamine transporter EutH